MTEPKIKKSEPSNVATCNELTKRNRCFSFFTFYFFGAREILRIYTLYYSDVLFFLTPQLSLFLSLLLCREYQWRPSISHPMETAHRRRLWPPTGEATTPDRRWYSSGPVVRALFPMQGAWSSPPILLAPFALSPCPFRLRKTLITGN